MLLFGHRFLQSECFYHISSIDAVINTPPSSTLYLEFDEKNLDIITYVRENGIKLSLSVKNITELIYASSLGAKYIIIQKELALSAQNIAETYLFDAKILVSVENDNQIEELANIGIDGLIYPNAIVKINS